MGLVEGTSFGFAFARAIKGTSLALLEDVVRRIPEIRYVGWDIAMTPDGPAVIEGNHNSSVFQPKPSASGVRTGLLPVYKAAFGF